MGISEPVIQEILTKRFKESICMKGRNITDVSVITTVIEALGKRLADHLSGNQVFTDADVIYTINSIYHIKCVFESIRILHLHPKF